VPHHRPTRPVRLDIVLFLKRPPLLMYLMQQILSLFEAGAFAPVPDQVYPIKHLAAALLRMSEGRHIGKLVVNFEGETVQVRSNPEGGG
jgi:NADPH:quinone reductase-like Zn-dependent oxidoreductase